MLGPLWGLPFAGLLLSIALMPLAVPGFWHRHYGKVVAAWALAYVLPQVALSGLDTAWHGLVHAAVGEYIPFIVLLATLFIVAGGIFVRGNLHGGPGLNVALMAIGAVLASVMGTTGASMLMIRPLIRANDQRRHTAHVVVFFIFIVSNAAGALTPLGDPPLFLGFLQGVAFSWTLVHMLPHTLFMVGSLLGIFWLLDRWYCGREEPRRVDPTPDTPDARGFGIEGAINLPLLAGVAGLILMSGVWQGGVAFTLAGAEITWQGLLRDLGLVAIAAVSWFATPPSAHAQNQFSFGPIVEVAKLFAGIFLTIIPVIAMLRAGVHGPFGAIVSAVTGPDGAPLPGMYFWASGVLSSFLDNAPTYLVFFNAAGGDAQQLMTQYATTLVAISAGSVFMGANSYIGNAPNLMVKAVAESRGIRMPGFFGYMGWSVAVLLPLFVLMTLIWF
jgi:Na+/H+ antiporter NhaD/arsenite permease-like protein